MRTDLRLFFLAGVSALGLCACGARSGLDSPPPRDAGLDAARAPVDAGRFDAGPPDGGHACPPCDDFIFCNGFEGCADDGSCFAGPVPTCDDGDECTVDRCDPGLDACVNTPLADDADGDGVGRCAGDCDDTDPTVGPGFAEFCDGRDTDCDGHLDEGLLSECLDCRPGCNRVPVPEETTGSWDLDRDSAGVEVGPDGALVLSTSRTETYFAWIANTLLGTITRLDTRDGRQAAEYDAALLDGTNGARPIGERCETERAGGNCPSRTAVDLRGAVYVANRAFFNQATVTKIAGFESDCIDRNGNGRIDTSRDLDGDGIIERSVPGEYLGQRDECLLWTVNVGSSNGVARSIAIDARGHPWVGLFNEGTALELDPSDGRVLRTVRLPASTFGRFSPYGAAADGRGHVWFTEVANGRIASIDTATGRLGVTTIADVRGSPCTGSYGIAVDENDRIWLAGFLCERVFRYDQDSRTWSGFSLPDSGATRGIAADGAGRILVASSHEWIRFAGGTFEAGPPVSRVTMLDATTGAVTRILGTRAAPLPGLASTGVGLDSSGAIWLINQESSTATRIDPTTFAAREFPTGTSPYTYSDFTGYALRTFTAPTGYHRPRLRRRHHGVGERALGVDGPRGHPRGAARPHRRHWCRAGQRHVDRALHSHADRVRVAARPRAATPAHGGRASALLGGNGEPARRVTGGPVQLPLTARSDIGFAARRVALVDCAARAHDHRSTDR